MEFRCRLGTPSGEIIEGVYVAQSEAALRRELEEKGLHVLSLRERAGSSASRSGAAPPHHRHEFLVFNQELATLLKAGMPLVQSLDILRMRLSNPSSRPSWTMCTRRCAGARRCRTRSWRTASISRVSTPRR